MIHESLPLLAKYLVGYVRSGFADVSVHFSHDRYVLIAIEERVLFISDVASPTRM